MNFLAPWALWFATITPVIVLLYLLKLRRRPMQVSTLLFWQRVLEENRRTALFQRLRNVLSLLLHLLIFALILLALAKPVFDRVIRQGASTVLIIDTRARMQAVDAQGVSDMKRAVRYAEELVGQATELREMAVIAAGAGNRVVAPFSGDTVQLGRVLEQLRPTDAGGDLEPALRLASDLLGSRAGMKRIVLLTDRKDIRWSPSDSSVTLEVRSIGSASDNVAITHFAARPIPASTDTSELLLTVQNFGREEFSGNVEITSDGTMLDVRPFRIAVGAQESVVFPSVPSPAQSSNRGLLTARIDHPDALATDNVAYAVLSVPQSKRVLLVSSGNWFLEKLLAADSRVKFEMLAPEAFRLPMAEQFDTVIFDRVVPAGLEFSKFAGSAIFIRESPITTAGKEIAQPLVSDVEEAHPALRLVSLQNITIGRAATLTIPSGENSEWRWRTPVRSFETLLLVTGERKRDSRTQRIAVLAFDLTASDLPLRIAFPLLMGNLLQWSAGENVEASERNVRAGETKEFPSPVAIAGPVLDAKQPASAEPATVRSFTPLQNGFYRAKQDATETWLAVNTFDPAESNLAHEQSAPTSNRTSASALTFITVSGWPLWRFLALAALGLLIGEWWLFHRRRTE